MQQCSGGLQQPGDRITSGGAVVRDLATRVTGGPRVTGHLHHTPPPPPSSDPSDWGPVWLLQEQTPDHLMTQCCCCSLLGARIRLMTVSHYHNISGGYADQVASVTVT